MQKLGEENPSCLGFHALCEHDLKVSPSGGWRRDTTSSSLQAASMCSSSHLAEASGCSSMAQLVSRLGVLGFGVPSHNGLAHCLLTHPHSRFNQDWVSPCQTQALGTLWLSERWAKAALLLPSHNFLPPSSLLSFQFPFPSFLHAQKGMRGGGETGSADGSHGCSTRGDSSTEKEGSQTVRLGRQVGHGRSGVGIALIYSTTWWRPSMLECGQPY